MLVCGDPSRKYFLGYLLCNYSSNTRLERKGPRPQGSVPEFLRLFWHLSQLSTMRRVAVILVKGKKIWFSHSPSDFVAKLQLVKKFPMSLLRTRVVPGINSQSDSRLESILSNMILLSPILEKRESPRVPLTNQPSWLGTPWETKPTWSLDSQSSRLLRRCRWANRQFQ